MAIKYKVPNGTDKKGNPKYKTKTYTFRKTKLTNNFVISVTDIGKRRVSVTAKTANQTFGGTRTNEEVKK